MLLKKRNYKIKTIIKQILLFFIIILSSIIISSEIYDNSWDGAAYHKVAIGHLKNGWNPVYEDVEEFNNSNPYIELKQPHAIWVNHYAKGYWIYAANVYKLTNNIESGKSALILAILATFLISYSFLILKIKKKYSVIISILLALNPVTIYQISSYYNDGLLGNFVIILIFSLLLITNKKTDEYKREKYLLFFTTISILINIKFTGFAFAGIYSLCYYIYIIINKKQRKRNLMPLTITAIIALIVSVGIMGYSSYVKNTIEHHHPFYPLYGEGKVDIMSFTTPAGLHNMNRFKRFIITNLSKSYSGASEGMPEYEIKIPFTFRTSELNFFKFSDVRLGGYGVLFGSVLVFSFFLGIYALIKYKKENKNYIKYLLIVIGTFNIIVLMKESWWARYFPQFYIMPLVVVIMLLSLNNKYAKIFSQIILVLLIINSFLIINPQLEEIKYQRTRIKEQTEFIKSIPDDKEILIVTSSPNTSTSMFDGAVFNLYDIHSNIKVINPCETIDGYKKYGFLGDAPKLYLFIKED